MFIVTEQKEGPKETLQEQLRRLPGVDRLLEGPEADGWLRRWPRAVVADVIRDVIAEARQQVMAGEAAPSGASLSAEVTRRLAARGRRYLRPVLNATGVVLHTNLGRAPLSDDAIAAVTTVAAGYSNLEYDLEAGRRGSRDAFGGELLTRLSGAEAGFVVNNNAAAVYLVLSALCRGKEVIISRGELIEIGGSFRIPEVMEQSGCVLKEVGTTNRTHLRDYERAIGDNTAAILKVHTSNYRIEGFTRSVPVAELAALCRERGILLIEDLGSGVFLDTRQYGLTKEPVVAESVAAGCDIVTFSGDKLLGGAQAGLIVGRADLVDECRRHPMARALRVDKMTIAALQATLTHYVQGEYDAIPLWRMMGLSTEELRERAQQVIGLVEERLASHGARGKVRLHVEDVRAAVGGGSLPGETVPSVAVAIQWDGGSPDDIAYRLRTGETPVIGRIENDQLLLDLRTVPAEADGELAALVADALNGAARSHMQRDASG